MISHLKMTACNSKELLVSILAMLIIFGSKRKSCWSNL